MKPYQLRMYVELLSVEMSTQAFNAGFNLTLHISPTGLMGVFSHSDWFGFEGSIISSMPAMQKQLASDYVTPRESAQQLVEVLQENLEEWLEECRIGVRVA